MIKKIVILIIFASNFVEASKKPEHEKPPLKEREVKKIKIVGEKKNNSESTVVSKSATSSMDQPRQKKASLLDAVTHVKELRKIILGYLTAMEDVNETAVKTLTEHTDYVNSVATSFNSKYVISHSRDHTLKLWDIASGKCLHTLQEGIHLSFEILPNSQYFILGSFGRLKIWDFASGKCLRILTENEYDRSLAISPDSQYAVFGSKEYTIKIWDIASGKCLHTLTGHTSHIYSIVVSPDSQYVIAGSDDKTIKIWDIASGKCIHTLTEHTGPIFSIAVSPDSQYVISGSSDKTTKIWNITLGKCLHTLTGDTTSILRVAVSANGKYIISMSWDTIKIWDSSSGKCLHTLPARGLDESAVVSPDSRYVISGSNDNNSIKIWDVASGKCLRTLAGHTCFLYSAAVSPNSYYIVSGSNDKTIKIWPTQAAMIEEFDAEQNNVQADKVDENDSVSKK